MWNQTPASRRLKIKYPIVQGPFGGGPSSVELTAAVSNAGGLGSYGMQAVEPAEMRKIAESLRRGTDQPFAINLWVAKEEDERREAARAPSVEALLRHYFTELKLEIPEAPAAYLPDLGLQYEAMLSIKPPVASFVFGVPPVDVLKDCRTQGITTMGTATTVDEARKLEEAGIDVIVASGFEAGGHRGAFLKPAEESLVGMVALIPQVADAVRTPFIAAGGIADARGIVAALALGAHGVQLGTAFLACDESGANRLHRAVLLERPARETTLTRALTGRLTRSMPNRLTRELDRFDITIPNYPTQGWFVSKIAKAALEQGWDDLISLSAGQAVSLVKRRRAADLMRELVADTPRLLSALGDGDDAAFEFNW